MREKPRINGPTGGGLEESVDESDKVPSNCVYTQRSGWTGKWVNQSPSPLTAARVVRVLKPITS